MEWYKLSTDQGYKHELHDNFFVVTLLQCQICRICYTYYFKPLFRLQSVLSHKQIPLSFKNILLSLIFNKATNTMQNALLFLTKLVIELISFFPECRWSEDFGCTSPNDLPLRCVGGLCGRILSGNPEQCPASCSSHSQCSSCLQDPNCGWCALDSGQMTGIGVCVKGTLENPRIGHCDLANFSSIVLPISGTVEPTSLSLQRVKDQAR